jgi:hypothetical protein
MAPVATSGTQADCRPGTTRHMSAVATAGAGSLPAGLGEQVKCDGFGHLIDSLRDVEAAITSLL